VGRSHARFRQIAATNQSNTKARKRLRASSPKRRHTLIFAAFPPNHWVVSRLVFVRSLSPSAAARSSRGNDWLHEPKWGGFRFQIIKDGSDVRLYSKSGVDYSNTLPSMRKAFAELPTNSAILDGELCLIDRGWRKLLPADAPRCVHGGQNNCERQG
jgi:ATP-dependent DNA ligase